MQSEIQFIDKYFISYEGHHDWWDLEPCQHLKETFLIQTPDIYIPLRCVKLSLTMNRNHGNICLQGSGILVI